MHNFVMVGLHFGRIRKKSASACRGWMQPWIMFQDGKEGSQTREVTIGM